MCAVGHGQKHTGFKGIPTRGVYCVEVMIYELGNMVNKITMWVYLCFQLGKPIKTPAMLFVLNEQQAYSL